MNEAVLEDVVCIVHILLARFPESISMTRFADKLSIASDQASVSAETKSSKCEAPKVDDGGWVWLQVYEIHEILEKVGLLMTADPWLTNTPNPCQSCKVSHSEPPGSTCRAAPLPNSSPTLALDASLGQHLEPADRSERWSGLQLTSTNWPQLKLLRCFRLRSQTLTIFQPFPKRLVSNFQELCSRFCSQAHLGSVISS